MAGVDLEQMSDWEKQERFHLFQPMYELSIGANYMRYLDVWRDARGGGLSGLNAARRIIGYLPTPWRDWAINLLDNFVTLNERGEAHLDFLRCSSAFIFHWVHNTNFPNPPTTIGFPLPDEHVQGHMAIDEAVPPPPSHAPLAVPEPPIFPPSMSFPPPNSWTHHDIFHPELAYMSLIAPSRTHSPLTEVVTAPMATVPSRPNRPSSSAGPSRLTARMSTIRPRMRSPFILSLPIDSEGNLLSPRGPLDRDVGSSSSGKMEHVEGDPDCVIILDPSS